jgi:CRP/FNR family transcriptional regulator, anaerobic regulatory protein
MTETNCEDCTLRKKECFRPLKPDELKLVSGSRSGQGELIPGRFLIRAGESPKALYTLYEGWAGACPDVKGRMPQVTEILLPGDLVGLQGCITGRYSHSVVALTRIRYCILDRSMPEKLAARGGSLCLAMLRNFCEERSRRERMATLLGDGSPTQRLAYFFLETFTRLKAVGLAAETMCPFPLRRIQIAQIVGLSEVHVSRTLATMRKDGLIDIANNILFISDEERLADIAKLKPMTYSEGRLIL